MLTIGVREGSNDNHTQVEQRKRLSRLEKANSGAGADQHFTPVESETQKLGFSIQSTHMESATTSGIPVASRMTSGPTSQPQLSNVNN